MRVALAAGREADDVAGHERFERARDRLVIGADQKRLAHMRDIEQAGLIAHVIVLGDDAVGVLHRHVVAGERHHAGPARDMERMQRGLLERSGSRGHDGVAGRNRCGLGGMFGRDRRRGSHIRRRVGLGGGLRLGVGRLGHVRFRIGDSRGQPTRSSPLCRGT